MGTWAAALAAVVLLAVTLPRFLVRNASQTATLPVARMDCRALEPLLAEAQPVPTASRVACIRSLPVGWTLGRVQARRTASVMTLDNERAGGGALQLTLTGHCDVGRAVAVPPAESGITRLRAPGGTAGFTAPLVRRLPGRLRPDCAAPGDPAGSGRQGSGRAGPGDRRVRLPRSVATRAGAAIRWPPAPELATPFVALMAQSS